MVEVIEEHSEWMRIKQENKGTSYGPFRAQKQLK